MYALRMRRRRDSLVAQLAGQLADAREQNGVLREQNAWLRAALPPQTLPRLACASGTGEIPYPASQAPRRSAARLTSM
jgi:hypothetical protein